MTEIEKIMCANYYKEAKRLTQETGIKHEVDHIWPLSRGGPHLPWSLMVITAEENRKKSDKSELNWQPRTRRYPVDLVEMTGRRVSSC